MYKKPFLKRRMLSLQTEKPDCIIEVINKIEEMPISEENHRIAFDLLLTVRGNTPEKYREDLISCYLFRLGYYKAIQELQQKKADKK